MGPRVPGRGRHCEHARPLLFLSPAAASAVEPLEGKRPSCQPSVASISPPLESLLGPVASLRGRDHLLLSFPRCYPALLATGRIRSLELPAIAGSPPPSSPHASEGPLLPCSFLEPGAREESAWISVFAVACRPFQARQLQPGSPAKLGHGGPRSSPPTPALRSLPPSSSGVGEVRLGAVGGWGSSLASGARRAWAGCWRHNEWDPGTARKSSFS